ncbi:MAG: amidohydrolase family protein [Chloroflexi bacterium]|nr:amidohydrolase family protein [Chloroflexota bacterium]
MLFGKSSAIFFHNAVVLNADGIIGESLRIENGKFAALDAAPRKNDFVVDCRGGLLAPGLINAHEHLGVNNFGRLKYRDVYPNAHAWSLDIEARFETDPKITAPRAVPIADRLFIGGIKNLLAGATTVCHHDPWHSSLNANFPVRVARPFGYCHSLQRGGDVRKSFRATPRGAAWIIHLAEGTDDASARELDQLDALGCLEKNTGIVHGVGLTPRQREKIIARGAGLIWCPSSNFFLLNKTANVSDLARAGLLALGTDSRLTGDGDIWDELRAANQTQQLTPRELFGLVTTHAARILRVKKLGALEMGAPADLILLPAPRGDPFAALVQTRRSDLQMVMLGGKPRLGDLAMQELFAARGVEFARVRVDGAAKLLDAHIARRLKRDRVGEAGVKLD